MSQVLKIAILAMGGEGGGVLANWIVDLGEQNGYIAQSTSVPGVAQRTGATIYYVELYPQAQAQADGATPVLALMPMPGDVDVVLASELMEAGRAVQRGLVTPERTTLVASTHRVFSIAEKMAMGDGRVDSEELLRHAQAAARRFVRLDMAQEAERSGGVISAVLLGALAGSGALPFGRGQYEATIERGGVGVRASLAAFGAAYERTQRGDTAEDAKPPEVASAFPATAPDADVRVLLQRMQASFPADAHPLLTEGLRRLIDYQDPAYAALYLDRVAAVCVLDHLPLTLAVARHLALWMSYEDTIRVADLKTRGERFERVRREVKVSDRHVLAVCEYLHPRLQEIAETLPVRLGRWLLASGWPRRLVERYAQRGRTVTTTSLFGFLLLYAVAGMRRWRRGTLRFALEQTRIVQWLEDVARAAGHDPDLAVEVAQCQRLVKGYSDTHERGLRSFEAIATVLRRSDYRLAAPVVRELREAALADEHGRRLQAALARHGLHSGWAGDAPTASAAPEPAGSAGASRLRRGGA